MIRFYTEAFFEELGRRLNEDETWRRTAHGVSLRIVCSAVDLRRAFLIDVRDGRVTTDVAGPDTAADFRFEGHYEDWMLLCKGEAELDRLVQVGKIRVAGSMPALMGLMGVLNRIVVVARSFPKEF